MVWQREKNPSLSGGFPKKQQQGKEDRRRSPTIKFAKLEKTQCLQSGISKPMVGQTYGLQPGLHGNDKEDNEDDEDNSDSPQTRGLSDG